MFHYMNRGAAFYRNVVRLALPILLQNLCTTLLGLIDTFMVGALGEAPLAAVLVANIPVFVIQLVIFGLQSGSSVLISQFWGKGDTESINRVIGLGCYVAGAISLAFASVMFFLPEQLMGLLTDNQELVDTGAGMLHIYFFGFCFMAFQMSGQATFTGLGKAKFAIFFSLFRKVALVLPLIFILPNFLGVDGVLWSEPISNLVGGGACFLVMMLTLWRKL